VLKGSSTFVTNGCADYVNQTGNPSLAVGGSGDTLTGIITGLICQKMEPFDAAILGVHLHGLAADIAHAELGTPSTLATDLLSHLPAAMKKVQP
jgi:NAD(P)H-hydrate epimerase